MNKGTGKKEIKAFLMNKAFADAIFQENLVDFGKEKISEGFAKEFNEQITFDRLLNKLLMLMSSSDKPDIPIYSQ